MEEETANALRQRRLGAGVYGKATLRVYDRAVLGLTNRLVWRCSSSDMLALYERFLTSNHLDVGVGSGFFLDRAVFPSPAPRLGLLDLSVTSLDVAARRLERYAPEVYRADVLRPLEIAAPPFSSIAMTYLLHCLPGPMGRKAVVFDNLLPLLEPGGVLFGATVVRHGAHTAPQAAALMSLYNAAGAFANGQDSADDLETELAARFDDVGLDVRGSVALFWGRSPVSVTISSEPDGAADAGIHIDAEEAPERAVLAD